MQYSPRDAWAEDFTVFSAHILRLSPPETFYSLFFFFLQHIMTCCVLGILHVPSAYLSSPVRTTATKATTKIIKEEKEKGIYLLNICYVSGIL